MHFAGVRAPRDVHRQRALGDSAAAEPRRGPAARLATPPPADPPLQAPSSRNGGARRRRSLREFRSLTVGAASVAFVGVRRVHTRYARDASAAARGRTNRHARRSCRGEIGRLAGNAKGRLEDTNK